MKFVQFHCDSVFPTAQTQVIHVAGVNPPTLRPPTGSIPIQVTFLSLVTNRYQLLFLFSYSDPGNAYNTLCQGDLYYSGTGDDSICDTDDALPAGVVSFVTLIIILSIISILHTLFIIRI